MFQLSRQEFDSLRFQIGISNTGRGGRRYLPYAFTEHGVAMLSSVLNSKRAVQMNILIIRAFVKLRELLATHKDLARRIEQMESKQKDHSVMLALVAKDIEGLATSVRKEFRNMRAPRRRKAPDRFQSRLTTPLAPHAYNCDSGVPSVRSRFTAALISDRCVSACG